MKYKVGDRHRCPKCGSEKTKIVWISEDRKTIGIQCPTSGPQHKRNAVILVDLEK